MRADGLIEGYRPGVMERLGLGPDALLADNPRLVYGRMTGWGQFGPYARAAGHDINYIALSGVLHTIGREGERPVPPVNYIGDFGGGGMMLAFGMVAALLAARNGGAGQVIDCAMTDGSALLAAMSYSALAIGYQQDRAGVNLLDGGAPFYDTYACADGKFVAIGSIEPQFYALMRTLTGLDADPDFDAQHDRAMWPELKRRVAAVFARKPRDAWCAIMEATDVCFAPVLSLTEAMAHPHNVARETFIQVGAAHQPSPAPRFSASESSPPTPATRAGSDSDSVMRELGYTQERIVALKADGVLA
jgi:alpha-methylacyl-CoA racemase